MSLLGIVVRAGLAYLFLLVMMRLAGKSVVAQATPFDFTLALIAGDLVDDLLWTEVPASQFFVAVWALFLSDVAVKLLSRQSDRFHGLVEGRPRVVVRDGEPQTDALRACQVHPEELACLLRVEGFGRDRWPEVRLGILETKGLSILRESWAEKLPRRLEARLREKLR